MDIAILLELMAQNEHCICTARYGSESYAQALEELGEHGTLPRTISRKLGLLFHSIISVQFSFRHCGWEGQNDPQVQRSVFHTTFRGHQTLPEK